MLFFFPLGMVAGARMHVRPPSPSVLSISTANYYWDIG